MITPQRPAFTVWEDALHTVWGERSHQYISTTVNYNKTSQVRCTHQGSNGTTMGVNNCFLT